jgi:hypothetical protein
MARRRFYWGKSGFTRELRKGVLDSPTAVEKQPSKKGNGDRGIRTPDLCDANAALSQLSYIPTEDLLYHMAKYSKIRYSCCGAFT